MQYGCVNPEVRTGYDQSFTISTVSRVRVASLNFRLMFTVDLK